MLDGDIYGVRSSSLQKESHDATVLVQRKMKKEC